MHINVQRAGVLAFFRPVWIQMVCAGLCATGSAGIANAQSQQRCDPWAAKLVSLEGQAEWRAEGEARWQAAVPDLIFCVGDTLKIRDSRAALRLPNETIVRLKEKTTLKFLAPRESFLMELLQGAAHFITRTPRRFDVKTPYLNAAVDGTEFLLAAAERNHRVAVFEGTVSVSSQWGTTSLNSGEQVSVDSAAAPHSQIRIKLRNTVAWALYYPPIVVPESTPGNIRQALDKGQIANAAELLSAIDDRKKTADDYSLQAALALYRGKTEAAREHIDKALALATDNPTALALQSIMLLIAGQPEQALAAAELLVVQWPQLAASYLALSYAQQSRFELAAAVTNAEKAVALQPENGLLHARLAELALMLGDGSRADKHGGLAVKFSPVLSRTHSVQGFASLNRLALAAAKASFTRAAELDAADPLPQLGLGLIAIRQGDLAAGREKIELAVALDPGSALLRSYLGKAYYEEKRNALADPQYTLAQELDPDDPTPWFYQALRKQSDNELLPALEDLDKAIELNDNRAVYRSRLLLDKDATARSASQARIYTAIHFNQLAILQGADAVAQAPQEHSGHRLLAQAYADQPRFETLRASERLQARLLQPLGAQPVPLGLGEPGLLVQPGAGPNDLGLNEFNSLFVQEGISGHASALTGSQDTEAFDWRVGGLYGRGAFELGQYQYSSDGFRENNDVNYTLYNAFGHFQVNDTLGVQLELQRREDEQGDVTQRFFAEDFSTDSRQERSLNSTRLGFNHRTSVFSHLLGAIIHRDIESETKDKLVLNPFVHSEISISSDIETMQSELQYLINKNSHSWIIGTVYFESEEEQSILQQLISLPPFPPFPTANPNSVGLDTLYRNSYIYMLLKPWSKEFEASLGLGYSDYDDRLGSDGHWNPKLGLVWNTSNNLKLRASFFESTRGPFQIQETLEPTHFTGFPQVFDEANFTQSKFHGFGLDYKISNTLRIGFNVGERNMKKPLLRAIAPTFELIKKTEIAHETSVNSYFYYSLNDKWSLSAELQLENSRRQKENLLDDGRPTNLKTYHLPLRMSYSLYQHLTVNFSANYIHQAVEFSQRNDVLSPSESFISEKSKFWTTDMEITYRLPNRWGTLTVEARNILNKDFNYQDTNFLNNKARPSTFVPERTILGRFIIYF